MTQDVAIRETTALTVQDLKGRQTRIQEVLKGVMINGVHYGTIPGCGDKPALLKAGAEKILSTFEFGVKIEPEHIIDLSDSTKVRIRVIAPIVHIHTGLVVGHGVGECSSEEEKYAWKKAVCDEEWNETDPDSRRIKWKPGKGGKPYQIKQIRTTPADVSNTILKMSKKRAVVDGTLTATAASDIFEQGEDVTGDEDEGFNREGVEHPKQQKPASTGPRMPGYAGKYANMPIVDVPLKTLQEFYPGILKSIADQNKAQWKDRNTALAEAMLARINELIAGEPEAEIMTAVDVCNMLTACQSMAELTKLMNEANAHKATYSPEDWDGIQITFNQKKADLTKKK